MDRQIIEQTEINESGSREIRIAKLDNKYWVYIFDWDTGQVTSWDGPADFARHTDDGIRYVATPYERLSDARRKVNGFLQVTAREVERLAEELEGAWEDYEAIVETYDYYWE